MDLLEIKYDRLSDPNRFLHDIFDGLKEYVSVDYPDNIFYKKNDMMIFEYDSKTQELCYSYEHIRLVFRDKFDLNYYETNEIIQSMVEEYLKLIVKSTRHSPFIYIV